ncbi:hypothetical protein FGG08_002424 [Glutinoglossum americanum]|uniref:Ankyrin n=1 Tax=Glutinoglossum americanum TaxID=1670608 RepID=A0A9P8KZ74_9PEZI|nr:hypothetical protein FGG08_002424 [Glutinoglossum americanum]
MPDEYRQRIPYTPIHRAVAAGQQKVVQLLIYRGVDANSIGPFGSTLTLATGHHSMSMIRLLLANHAELYTVDKGQANSFQTYRNRDSEEMIRDLLNHGADVNLGGDEDQNSLCAAVMASWGNVSSLPVVGLLIAVGADVNDVVGGYRGRALYLASVHSLLDAMRILLDAGADINTHGGEFGTALHAATGANVSEVVESQGTPLEAAIAIRDEEGVELLLDHGADLEIAMLWFFAAKSLQHLTEEAGRDMQALLKSGAGARGDRQEDCLIERALMGAAVAKNSRATEVLLEETKDLLDRKSGAKLERESTEAARVGSHAVVKLLLDRGVRADAIDRHSLRDRGDTALQVAWRYSFEDTSEEHNAVAMELLGRGSGGEWCSDAATELVWIDL